MSNVIARPLTRNFRQITLRGALYACTVALCILYPAILEAQPFASSTTKPSLRETYLQVLLGSDAGEVSNGLAELGYLRLATDSNNKASPAQLERALSEFAKLHFESSPDWTKAFPTVQVIKAHLANARMEPTFNNAAAPRGKPITVYRIGVSRWGGLRYVLGGPYANVTPEAAKTFNQVIAKQFQTLSAGQEVFFTAFDEKGTAMFTRPVNSSVDSKKDATTLSSTTLCRPRTNGQLTKGSGTMVPLFEQSPAYLRTMWSSEITVDGPFGQILPGNFQMTCKVTDNTQVFRVEVGRGNDAPIERSISVADLRSDFIAGERVLFSGTTEECKVLKVIRPKTTN